MRGSVYKRGDIWYYRFDIGKGKEREQFTRVGTKDKAETEQLMRQAMKEFDDTGKIFIPNEMSYAEFLDIWFDECIKTQKRHGTREDYGRVIRKHIKPHEIGKMKIKDIEPEHLQSYIDEKSKEYAKSTMKSHFVVLNKSFKYGVFPKKYIKENPMIYVEKRTINKDLDTFTDEEEELNILTLDEYRKITEVLEGKSYLLPIQIAYHTGMRQGEIAGLTWRDIDLKKKTITVNKSMFYNLELKQWELGPTKSGKARVIDLGDTLIDILNKSRKDRLKDRMKYGPHYLYTFLEKHEVEGQNHIRVALATNEEIENNKDYYNKLKQVVFVCAKENGELVTNQTVKYGSKVIKDKIPELKKKFKFHALRHTHATNLIENGATMKAVQDRLGHANISITMDIYASVTPKMRQDTVDIFEKMLSDD